LTGLILYGKQYSDRKGGFVMPGESQDYRSFPSPASVLAGPYVLSVIAKRLEVLDHIVQTLDFEVEQGWRGGKITLPPFAEEIDEPTKSFLGQYLGESGWTVTFQEDRSIHLQTHADY